MLLEQMPEEDIEVQQTTAAVLVWGSFCLCV